MAYDPFPQGQKVMASSRGVVIASDQTPVSVAGMVGASIIGLPTIQTGNTSVISIIQGSVATVIIGGSILTSSTANQSVSGVVGASIIGIPTIQTGNTSVISLIQGSIAAVIIGGSIATATTNSSVMLLNGANTIGSVTTLQGTNPWVVVGSVYQGTGWSGSVAATVTNTNLNVGGSVVAFQGGIQITSLVSTTPSSVQVGASIMGIAPVTLTANTIPASALAFLGATTSITAANTSIVTVTGYPQATLQIVSNPSMTGTIIFEGSADNASWVPITGYNQANNTLASVTTSADGNWAFNTAGLQTFRARLSAWTAGSITGKVYLSPADARPFTQYITGNPSISGTVLVGGTPNVNTAGSVVAFQGTNPWIETFSNSSIIAINAGSVVAISQGSIIAVLQSSSLIALNAGSVVALSSGSVITLNQGSSILAVPVGSVITVFQAPSIVGTYAEDAAAASGDKGFLVMGARNDTLASVTSNDGDYSSHVVGPAGELIAENAPLTKWVSGTASMLGGIPLTTSVTVIAAQGASIFTYITGVQVANLGSASVLVSFGGATSSLIGYTIAPAGGGSNIYYQNGLKTNANAAFSASVSGAASIYVSAQGFISKS